MKNYKWTKEFYFKLSNRPNVDILSITVSMWKQHDSETIFTSNSVMSIQVAIGKCFVSRERSYSIGLNDCFGPRRKIYHKKHLTMYLENPTLKYIITDRKKNSRKLAHIQGKLKKSGQEVMCSLKKFNTNYMFFFVMKHVTNEYGHQVKVA